MKATSASPELLKRAVLELVGECRQQLARGEGVDASEVMRGVKTYCAAIAALPRGEGRKHAQELKALMQVMTELSDELVAARDAVHAKLEALGKIRQASDAYQKSDAIGGTHKKSGKKS